MCLLVLLGVIIETDNAYKRAMDISNIVMPAAPLLRLPEAVHNSQLAEHPSFKQFDGMTMFTSTMVFYDGEW